MVYIDKEFILQNFSVGDNPCSVDTGEFPSGKYDEHTLDCPEADESKEAWRKLMRLLSVRDRSVKECESKLAEAGFSAPSIESAIARALRCRFLDDARYADSFVRAKLAAGKGLKGIVEALSMWGIAAENLHGFPDEFLDGEDEFSRACAFIASHPTRSKNPWKSSYAKLLRCGYDHDSAYRAASWYASEQIK